MAATQTYEPNWMEKVTGEVTDWRVRDWPMMNSPNWFVAIAALYLYVVMIAGPRAMKKREPYSLKTFIACYNIGQVLANCTMFYTVLTSGWTTTYQLLGCTSIDRSDSPEAMRMASAFWWWYILKMVELSETVVFILRKKDRQVSFLHVYHHVSMFSVAWIACAFCPGGFVSFSILPNSFIHVVMYSYYLLSTIENASLQKRLSGFKKYITTAQMVQFVLITSHAAQAFRPGCEAPMFIMYYYVPNVAFFFYLFYDFYKNNYRSHSSTAAEQREKGE